MSDIIQPTVYTQQFFQSDFSDHMERVANINTGNNLVKSEIPAVEVPGLDTSILTELYEWAKQLDSEFYTVETAKMFNDWYTQPRSSGWKELNLEHDTSFSIEQHSSDKFVERVYRHYDNKDLLALCKKLLAQFDLKMQGIKITKLEPGAWINPHADRHSRKFGLCYVWIPLHNFDPCLKIFPYGWLQHQYSNMYLFNQSSYLHAVRNSQDYNRYVLLGWIDPNAIPDKLQQAYQNNKSSYAKLWSQ